jgi:hypothetical protein
MKHLTNLLLLFLLLLLLLPPSDGPGSLEQEQEGPGPAESAAEFSALSDPAGGEISPAEQELAMPGMASHQQG